MAGNPNRTTIMQTPDGVRFWRNPALASLEVCRVEGSRHVFPNHFHDDIYAVGLMEAGASHTLGPGHDEALVVQGTACLINPGMVHSGVPVPGTAITYWMLYLDAAWMRRAATDLRDHDRGFPEFTDVIAREPAVNRRLRRLCGLAASSPDDLELESALVAAMGDLLTAHGGVSPSGRDHGDQRRAMRRAKEFLSADLDGRVTLDQAARAAGLSRWHFLRVFKRATGVPPHVFRTQRRVSLARRLLRAGMPPAHVALETGFTDQSHFTRTFRRYTGATPGQYQAADKAPFAALLRKRPKLT